MKATILNFLQRVHGWCEWMKGKISPLLELPVMNRKASNLYLTISSGWINYYFSNLGGNAVYFRPIYMWDGSFLFYNFIIINFNFNQEGILC